MSIPYNYGLTNLLSAIIEQVKLLPEWNEEKILDAWNEQQQKYTPEYLWKVFGDANTKGSE